VPDAVFGLGAGLVDLLMPISDTEQVTVHRAGPGFWIGESALLAETVRMITLAAATECRVFRIPAAAVRRHLADHPEDWPCFFRLSHVNLQLTMRVHAEYVALPPQARFARMLLRMAGPDGAVRATQEELGQLAGMSRAAFRRTFAELIGSGALKTEYGAVRIVDGAALERAAQAD
jgi:CRP-like cAMP-binding protein